MRHLELAAGSASLPCSWRPLLHGTALTPLRAPRPVLVTAEAVGGVEGGHDQERGPSHILPHGSWRLMKRNRIEATQLDAPRCAEGPLGARPAGSQRQRVCQGRASQPACPGAHPSTTQRAGNKVTLYHDAHQTPGPVPDVSACSSRVVHTCVLPRITLLLPSLCPAELVASARFGCAGAA